MVGGTRRARIASPLARLPRFDPPAMPTRPLLPSLRRALIGLTLAALALTQGLGVLHRALHAQPALNAAQSLAASGPGTPLHEALFGNHRDSSDCQLFDQLAHADLAWGEAAAGPLPASKQALPAPHPTAPLAARAFAYLPRGPPTYG